MPSPHILTVRDGLASGLDHRDLKHLPAPVHGARVISIDCDDVHFEAIRAVAHPDQFFSHSTAARLHGIPLPPRMQHDLTIHVASPSKRARMERPGVQGHRIKSEVVEVLGLRVESIEDCWVHLGMQLSVDELVAAGDWIISDDRPWSISVDDLFHNANKFKGARFMGVVRTALVSLRKGAESVPESRTRMLVCKGGLPEPSLQWEVFDELGKFVARLDLCWPDIKLAIEYDGEHHRTDPHQYTRDIARIRNLQAEGWTVVRVTMADFADGGKRILELIQHEFKRCERVVRVAKRRF